MQRVRVGVIGLGEVGQIIHLPILQALQERYEIAALCDISRTLREAMGERYAVDRLYADAADLCADPALDAVFVLNSDEYHADCVVAAARAGKHVLVEKPMCLTLADAERIVAAREETGVRVLVGYMRRYAPAFVQAVEEVRGLDAILYARVRDIIGPNRLMIEQSSAVLRPADFPEGALRERTERARSQVREAIGDAADEFGGTYRLLCGLSSHDLSAMRELLGFPERVIAAARSEGGRFLSVLFGYPSFVCSFETGVDSQRRFDAHLEVYGESRSVRVQYDTPYIRHLPTTLVVEETAGEAFEQRVVRPTYTDPYTHELEYFHAVVTDGLEPKTSPEDSMEDLRLFQLIIDALGRSARAETDTNTAVSAAR